MNSFQALMNASNVIDANLSKGLDRQELAANILAQLRNLVDALFFMFYEKDYKVTLEYDWENISKARKYCYAQAKYKLIYKFHSSVQISTSHYTLDDNNSDRLMLKYYENLLEIKAFIKTNLNIDILKNLKLFPLNQDKNSHEFYVKISQKLTELTSQNRFTNFDERFYVEKIKPFFVNGRVFYEITLSPCNDKRSKFDRMIVFSKFKILDNYAIKAKFVDAKISVFDFSIPIKIVSSWMISIRPCEVNNLAKYFNFQVSFKAETKEL